MQRKWKKAGRGRMILSISELRGCGQGTLLYKPLVLLFFKKKIFIFTHKLSWSLWITIKYKESYKWKHFAHYYTQQCIQSKLTYKAYCSVWVSKRFLAQTLATGLSTRKTTDKVTKGACINLVIEEKNRSRPCFWSVRPNH